MQYRHLVVSACLLLGLSAVGCRAEIQLEFLSTTYLPYAYTLQGPHYGFDKDAAEQNAYDSANSLLYSVGTDTIHVLDISDPVKPRVVHHTTLPGAELTDVETCGGYVAVAVENKTHPLEGRVYVYSGYEATTGQMHLLHDIIVGALPDMLQFTKNCGRIVVAIEGELRMVNGHVVDPEGGVAVIRFCSNNPSEMVGVKFANFTQFNDVADQYVARGVRRIFRGEGTNFTTTLSQDLEPEYVALSEDDTKAFIILQENNAVAILDVEKAEIIALHPLGAKSWEGLGMDASDRDNGINLRSWPLYGLYQPDGAKHVTIGGRGYLLTANEGDEKEYEKPEFPFEFSEGMAGRKFVEKGLVDDSVSSALKEALGIDAKLGRLRLSTLDGVNPATGKYNKFYSYGARSFTIWDVHDWSVVYDSGDDVERRIAQYFPKIFNSHNQKGGPETSFDGRSGKKGPETETLDVGKVNEKTVLFIASERPGVILIYSIPGDDVTNPVFESAHYAGGSCKSWKALYRQRKTRDVDPEDIRFVSPAESPNGEPMLIVSGTTTGTVSLYKVIEVDTCRCGKRSSAGNTQN